MSNRPEPFPPSTATDQPDPGPAHGPGAGPARGPGPARDPGLPGSVPLPFPGSVPFRGPFHGTGTFHGPYPGAAQLPSSGTFQGPYPGASQRPISGTFHGPNPNPGAAQRPNSGTFDGPDPGAAQRPSSGTFSFPDYGAPELESDRWTLSELQAFEMALVAFPEGTPSRWEKVASWVPGKTADEVYEHHLLLLDAANDLESGKFDDLIDELNDINMSEDPQSSSRIQEHQEVGRGRGRGSGKKVPAMKLGTKRTRWSEAEHSAFIEGLNRFGRGAWKKISQSCVKTRTPEQVANHAYKYFRSSKFKEDQEKKDQEKQDQEKHHDPEA